MHESQRNEESKEKERRERERCVYYVRMQRDSERDDGLSSLSDRYLFCYETELKSHRMQ
jgi:hypothetical protein